MPVTAVYNLKGGVGKTATTVNLAYLSARDGYPTLVWDLDPQAAATFYFRIRPKVKGSTRRLVRGKLKLSSRIRGTDFDLLDLLPADLSYRKMDIALDRAGRADRRIKRLLKPFQRDYSQVFLDCPPGLTQVSVSVFYAADVLLVPVIPTVLSLRTLDLIESFLRKRKITHLRVLPFFSMADRRKRLHQDVLQTESEGRSHPFLRTVIPYSSAVEQMGLTRAPLLSYDRRSLAARAYADLWRELAGRSESPSD